MCEWRSETAVLDGGGGSIEEREDTQDRGGGVKRGCVNGEVKRLSWMEAGVHRRKRGDPGQEGGGGEREQ
eukprot:3551823-Prymnesium_polylepis.1